MVYTTTLRYTDRATKARFIASKYAPILRESVLDVGCDEGQLGRELQKTGSPGVRYVGVDMNDRADVVHDLERSPLPFAEQEFETVICADVLEHLEHLHAAFDELCRVAKSRVVISLPNPLRNLLLAIAAGSRGALKYYGLPIEAPRDRHRWFFGAEEAESFVRARAVMNGFGVEQIDFEEKGCPEWIGAAGDNVIGSKNATHGTMWAVLARR